MTVDELVKQISAIMTPNTDNFYKDIRIYGLFHHIPYTIIWSNLVKDSFIIRADIDVRAFRKPMLNLKSNDCYSEFQHRINEFRKVLILFDEEYDQAASDVEGANIAKYTLFYEEHPFVKCNLWSGTMDRDYAYIVDLEKKSYSLASHWETQSLPFSQQKEYFNTRISQVYNILLKDLDGIESKVQADYIKLKGIAAKVAYIQACFDLNDVESINDIRFNFLKLKEEFYDELLHFSKAIDREKSTSAIYELLTENDITNLELANIIAFIAAVENQHDVAHVM